MINQWQANLSVLLIESVRYLDMGDSLSNLDLLLLV